MFDSFLYTRFIFKKCGQKENKFASNLWCRRVAISHEHSELGRENVSFIFNFFFFKVSVFGDVLERRVWSLKNAWSATAETREPDT